MDVSGNVAVGSAAAVDVIDKKPTLTINPRPILRWKFDVDTDALQYNGRDNVVLILGDPNEDVIHNLVRSSQLSSNCLLIFALHSLPVHLNTLAASLKECNSTSCICLLRLSSELALYEDGNGAARLVRILEKAQEVAMLWRKADKDRSAGVIEEVFENADDIGKPGNGSDRRKHGRLSNSSVDNGSTSPQPSSFTWDSSRNPSKLFSRSATTSLRGQKSITTLTHAHRIIDTIIHILPSHERIPKNTQSTQPQYSQSSRLMRQPLTDKSLLKSVVLVTTLSRPFLLHPGEDRDRTNAFEKQFTAPAQTSLRYNKDDRRESHSLAEKKSISSRIFGSSVASFSVQEEENQYDMDPRSIYKRSKTLASSHPTSISENVEVDAWAKISTERNAEIIHVLPSYGNKKNFINPLVIQRLESFLLTFCSPRTKREKESQKRKEKEKGVDFGFEVGRDDNNIVPYLINLALLSSEVPISLSVSHPLLRRNITMLDLILSGSLNGRLAINGQLRQDKMEATLKNMVDEKTNSVRRAWISGLNDVDLDPLLKASLGTIKKPESAHIISQNKLASSTDVHPSSPPLHDQALTQQLGSNSRKEALITHLSPSTTMNDKLVTKPPLVRPRTAGSLTSEFKSYSSLYVVNENSGKEDDIDMDKESAVHHSSKAHQYHYTRKSASRSPSPPSPNSELTRARIKSPIVRPRSESLGGSKDTKVPIQGKSLIGQMPKIMSESTPHLPNQLELGTSKTNSKEFSTINSTLSLSVETGIGKDSTIEDVKPNTRSLRKEKSTWKFWR